jgi:hypothetical protein
LMQDSIFLSPDCQSNVGKWKISNPTLLLATVRLFSLW